MGIYLSSSHIKAAIFFDRRLASTRITEQSVIKRWYTADTTACCRRCPANLLPRKTLAMSDLAGYSTIRRSHGVICERSTVSRWVHRDMHAIGRDLAGRLQCIERSLARCERQVSDNWRRKKSRKKVWDVGDVYKVSRSPSDGRQCPGRSPAISHRDSTDFSKTPKFHRLTGRL